MLAAFVVPLSSEPTAALAARPALFAGTLLAALLYAAAPFLSERRAIAITFAGVLLGCAVTLALLRDHHDRRQCGMGVLVAGRGELDRRMARRCRARRRQAGRTRWRRAQSIWRSRSCSVPSSFICGRWRCAASACRRCCFRLRAKSRSGSSARCGCCGRISSRPSFLACSPATSSAAAPASSSPSSPTATPFSAAIAGAGKFRLRLPIVGIAPIMVMWSASIGRRKPRSSSSSRFFRCW